MVDVNSALHLKLLHGCLMTTSIDADLKIAGLKIDSRNIVA